MAKRRALLIRFAIWLLIVFEAIVIAMDVSNDAISSITIFTALIMGILIGGMLLPNRNISKKEKHHIMFKWTRLPEGIDPWETSGVLGVDYNKDDSVWVWVDTDLYPYPLEES